MSSIHQKQEYLLQYSRLKSEYDVLLNEFIEIRGRMGKITADYSFTPHGSGFQGKEGLWAKTFDKLDEISYYMAENLDRQQKTLIEIQHRIYALDSLNESNVLSFRYILGLKWSDVAKRLGFSERQVYRLHDLGLKHLEIPE